LHKTNLLECVFQVVSIAFGNAITARALGLFWTIFGVFSSLIIHFIEQLKISQKIYRATNWSKIYERRSNKSY